MTTLLPSARDFLNLKIENKPELWSTLKNFRDTVIHVRFTDSPFKKYSLVFFIDADGLIKSSEIKIGIESKNEVFQSTLKNPDIKIYISNEYLNNVGNEFVGWAFDFSKEEFPDSSVFTNGLKIEGDAGTIQELAPLLKLILDDLSPIATLIKKSPANNVVSGFFEFVLKKEKLLVLQDDFHGFAKSIRDLRNDIERSEKKIEILERNLN